MIAYKAPVKQRRGVAQIKSSCFAVLRTMTAAITRVKGKRLCRGLLRIVLWEPPSLCGVVPGAQGTTANVSCTLFARNCHDAGRRHSKLSLSAASFVSPIKVYYAFQRLSKPSWGVPRYRGAQVSAWVIVHCPTWSCQCQGLEPGYPVTRQ